MSKYVYCISIRKQKGENINGVAQIGYGVAQLGCGVAQLGCAVAQLGCCIIQIGCGVAQIGCSVAQIVVRRLDVRQARVRIPARRPR
jgi:hypothetical protein